MEINMTKTAPNSAFAAACTHVSANAFGPLVEGYQVGDISAVQAKALRGRSIAPSTVPGNNAWSPPF